MGGWDRKVSVNELLLFCEGGKTRGEISDEFKLTPAESWSATKYLSKLRTDIVVQKNKGRTHRVFVFTTYSSVIKDLKK